MQRRAAGIASSRASAIGLPAGLAVAVGAGVELRERVLDLVERVVRAGPRAPRPRRARRSPGPNPRSSRRSDPRAAAVAQRSSWSRRRCRSSWSWSRSTAWVVSAIRPVYSLGHRPPTRRQRRARGCAEVVDGPQAFGRHLGVDLRRRQAGVARATPGPPGCRRRGRACGSRTSGAARAGTGGHRARPVAGGAHDEPRALPGESTPARVEEHRVVAGRRLRSSCGRPRCEVVGRARHARCAQRHHALLAPLARARARFRRGASRSPRRARRAH